MSKFRVNKKSNKTEGTSKHHVDDSKLEAFGKGALVKHELGPDDASKQSFTIPINGYHLNILRLLKEKEKID